MKRWLARPAVAAALSRLAAAYIRLVHRTTRWTTRIDAATQTLDRSDRPYILSFWHGRMMLLGPFWTHHPPSYIMISGHLDGRLIAQTIAHLGYRTVFGSSSSGGRRALHEMVRLIRGGAYAGITPDGPRGPRMRASEGAIALARLAGAPLVPATFSVSNGRELGSWDRFLLGLPFGRGAHLVGAPIEVAADSDTAALEAARLALESALNALTAEADRMCGRVPVEAAAPDAPVKPARRRA